MSNKELEHDGDDWGDELDNPQEEVLTAEQQNLMETQNIGYVRWKLQIEQKASPHQAQELQFTTLANPGKEASLPFTLVRKCIFSNVEGLCSRQVLSLECRIDSPLIRLTVQKFQFDWTTSSNWSVLWAYSKSWKET